MAAGALRVPWIRAIDSILLSHLYFGGWSALGVRAWMVHLFYAVILLAAIWLGLWAANRIVRPISRLIGAAERVSEGDLKAQVFVDKGDDELASLGHAFNRMTEQLDGQRGALIAANKQIGFFSDAYCVEWTYGKALLVRKQLAQVLADKIQQGQYTRDGALATAKAILFETPRSLMGMTPWNA